ncbi:MAG: T9SS type A sorting domain-containing protein [Candidatus Krumholzibacteriia bacterium]
MRGAFCCLLVLILCFPSPAGAAGCPPEPEVIALDGWTSEGVDTIQSFGHGVAITEDCFVVGAPGTVYDDWLGHAIGAAIAFEPNAGDWQPTALIQPPLPWSQYEDFGNILAMRDDVLAVGDSDFTGGLPYSGRVLVYARNGGAWTLEDDVRPDWETWNGHFGRAIAVDNAFLMVSTPGAMAGSMVQVYARDPGGWVTIQYLEPGDIHNAQSFGSSLALDGEWAILGQPEFNTDTVDEAGRVCFYRKVGGLWIYWSELSDPDPSPQDHLGTVVAIAGDQAIAGVPRDGGGDTNGYLQAFRFDGSTWILTSQLPLLPPGEHRNLGSKPIVMDGKRALVESNYEDSSIEQQRLHLFEYDGVQWQRLQSFDIDTYINSFDMAGDRILVGGPSHAFLYTYDPYPFEEAGMLASGAPGGYYGSSVALDGTRLVVGAQQETNIFNHVGAAYVYESDGETWALGEHLVPADGGVGDKFGAAAAVEGDRIAVGSPSNDEAASGAGAVYLYELQGGAWTQTDKLMPAELKANDSFGAPLVMQGDWLFAAATDDDSLGSKAGAVYAYHREGGVWMEQQKLLAPDGYYQDFFGYALALDGDRLAIGVPRDDDTETDSGAVWIYERDGLTWLPTLKLHASNPDYTDGFGEGLALQGNRLVIGTPGDDDAANAAGAIYVYEFDGADWQETDKLVLENAAVADGLGKVVALHGDLIVAGVPNDGEAGYVAGAAHVFVREPAGWIHHKKLIAADTSDYDRLGFSVTTDGLQIAVGAATDNLPNGSNLGSVRLWGLPCEPISTAVPPLEAAFGDGPAPLVAWPNPLRRGQTLALEARAGAGPAVLEVYDVAGRRLRRLAVPSTAVATVDLGELPAGVYLARLQQGGESRTGKLVLLR